MPDIHICEVGPRDGLQNAKHLMSTEAKKAWIRALARAGLAEIEVGSFVPPKLIPAMRTRRSLRRQGPWRRLKGFQRAIEVKYKVTFPGSASPASTALERALTPSRWSRKCARAQHPPASRSRARCRRRLAAPFAGRGAGGRRGAHRSGARRVPRHRGACRYGAGYANPAQVKDFFPVRKRKSETA